MLSSNSWVCLMVILGIFCSVRADDFTNGQIYEINVVKSDLEFPSHGSFDAVPVENYDLLKISRLETGLTMTFQGENTTHSTSIHYVHGQDFDRLDEHLLDACAKLTNESVSIDRCNHQVYSKITKLDLSFNRLVKFPSGQLLNRWFTRLEHLNLSNNLIEYLNASSDARTADFAFMLAKNSLVSMDLSLNRLEKLDEECFRHLKSLRYLNLSKNQLKNVNLFSFSTDAHTLNALDLSHNLITDQSMEFLLFSSFVNLKQLNLNFNRLQTMSSHLLLNLYNLECLHLNHNNLKSFDLFLDNANVNNERLRLIDLSFNLNLKLTTAAGVDSAPVINSDENFNLYEVEHPSTSNGHLEELSLAGVDLSQLNVNKFLDGLFQKYTRIKVLNMTSTRIKSLRTNKWPPTIETIDLSDNQITQFECGQFLSANGTIRAPKLKYVNLASNRLSNFKQFLLGCAPLLNKSLTIDLTYNQFENLDSLSSNETMMLVDEASVTSLLLDGNPLICDCEENNWWSRVDHTSNWPTLFVVNGGGGDFTNRVHVKDYERLKCASISKAKLAQLNADGDYANKSDNGLWSVTVFEPIRDQVIAPRLVCPYKFACSTKTCECCGFRACDCSFHCPAACKCARDYANTFDLVNCSHASLAVVPGYLPMTTSEIMLNDNRLKRLQPYQFFGRFHLTKIDLSNNNIMFIEEHAFNGLNQLKTLNLARNSLQILLGYEFRDLFYLEELSLENNQIQFVSNLTFSYLVALRYLNLANNHLRHVLESRVYFEFNVNLVNLSLDANRPNLISYNEEFTNLIKEKKSNKKQARKIPTLTELEMTYAGQIKQHLGNKQQQYSPSSELVQCILGKFRRAIQYEYKNNRTFRSLFVIIGDDWSSELKDKLRALLAARVHKFKANCKDYQSREEDEVSEFVYDYAEYLPKSLSLAQNYDADGESESEAKSDDHQTTKEPPVLQTWHKSAVLVVNYRTFALFLLMLIVLIVVFSITFAYLINRLQAASNVRKRNRSITSISSSSGTGSSASISTLHCLILHPHTFFKSIKNKFRNLTSRRSNSPSGAVDDDALNHPRQVSNQRRRVFDYRRGMNSSSLSSSTTSSTTSCASGSSYSRATTTSTSNHTRARSQSMLDIHVIRNDLFIVYNRVDADLVHKIIAPIFKSAPYNFRIALQHDPNGRDPNPITTNNNHFVKYVKQSEFVLFVVSRNLLTDVEYDLAYRTPKIKKLAILADDVSESLAEKLIQPSRILRATFNLNSMSFYFKPIGQCDSSSTSSSGAIASDPSNESSNYTSQNYDTLFESVNETNLLRHDKLLKKKLNLFNKIEF